MPSYIPSLRFATFNAAGINRTPDEITKFCTQQHIDFILITETYLSEGQKLYTEWIQHHNFAKIPGEARRGFGGISLLIRPDFPYHIHPQLPHRSDFILSFSLGPYKFHGVYFPPHSMSFQAFTDTLDNLPIDDHTFVFGDFNTRLGNITGDHRINTRARPFNQWITRHNLTNWNARLAYGKFTYRQNSWHSIIDYVISSSRHIANASLKIFDQVSLSSDHHVCRFRFIPLTPIPMLDPANAIRQHWKLQRLEEREVKELYITQFESKASEIMIDMEELATQERVDTQALESIGSRIEESIHTALDNSVTRGEMRPKHWRWFWTEELQGLADRREQQYRRWRNSRRGTLTRAAAWREYCNARDELKNKIQQARYRHWQQYCRRMATAETCETNSTIKRIKLNKTRSQNSLSHPQGPRYAAEMMINHLATVFGGEQEYPRRPPTYTRAQPDEDIFTPSTIEKIICKLAPRKAPGMDHITGAMLKPIVAPLSRVLSAFMSICWQYSWTPLSWRSAQVIPIFKKGNPSEPANYRPISLTTTFRKILERCLLPVLLEQMPALDIAQGGFRAKRGALDQAFNLHMLMRQFQRQYDEAPVVAFLDIKAAYDSVDRSVIWQQLTGHIDHGLLYLLRNMFDDVRISVVLKNQQSRWIKPNRGVLQGSILSPMLYALFIDTLPHSLRLGVQRPLLLKTPRVQHLSEFEASLVNSRNTANMPDTIIQPITSLLYADDVALFGTYEDVLVMLAAAERHSNYNGYRWHPDKCVILNAPNQHDMTLPLDLYMQPIPLRNQFTYLGIPFDGNGIDQESMVRHLSNKTQRTMEMLRKIGAHQYGFGLGTSLRIYRTFVRPILEYGLAITKLNQEHSETIEKAQTQCIRKAINVITRRPVPTIVQKHIADLQSMAIRAEILRFKFVWRALHGPNSSLLHSLIRSFLEPSDEEAYTDSEWKALSKGDSEKPALFQMYCDLTSQLPLPRDPKKYIITATKDKEMQDRRNQFPAVARARARRIWDPILYLPATRVQRHRLIKWRCHWLPPFPSPNCRCGVQKVKRDHYLDCSRLDPIIQRLEQCLGTRLLARKDEDTHIIDFIFNMLPRSSETLQQQHWRHTWPTLLDALRDIDIACHPDAEFEPETQQPLQHN